MPAIAALGFKLTPGRNFAGALKPEAGLSPVQDQIAVEEFERRRFLCGRLIAAGGEALNKGRVPGAAQHGATRNDALQTRDRYNTAFATVPDQRCTASLSLALHRIRDTSDLILEAVAAVLRPFEREPL